MTNQLFKLLPIILLSGCSTKFSSVEDLRTTARRISEIDGQIQNSCQILAHCAARHRNGEVRIKAAEGILSIVGPPDASEITYAEGLTSESVDDVTSHGLVLTKKTQRAATIL